MSAKLGSKIREIRRMKGKGYVEHSYKTGIDTEEIIKIENGEIPVIALILSRITNVFDVTLEFQLKHVVRRILAI